jgi:hypothetical protein
MNKPIIPDEPELFEILWNYRRSVQYIEREYLDLRVRLRDAEADLRSDLQNRELKESRHPWISTGRPSEIPFWVNSVV